MLTGYAQALSLLRARELHSREDVDGKSHITGDHRPAQRPGIVTARWKGVVVAESGDTVEIEGNHYFPPEAVRWRYLVPSEHRTVCPWKGEAVYYHVQIEDSVNQNAAWSYPEPKKAAAEIRGHVAFWKGVIVR